MKKVIEEIEMLSRQNIGVYSQRNRTILERRWEAYKFIKLGIHSVEENKEALEITERLMDISNSMHSNRKDDWLLNKLVDKIMRFEKKEYPKI